MYQLPERFDLSYVGSDNALHRPVMIHRAPFGSMERFVGVLIEHFAGAFPLWLSPVQVRILTIADRHIDHGCAVLKQLTTAGFRGELDKRQEKIGLKIREAQLEKIPYMLVIGDRELENGTVALRSRKDGDQGSRSISEVINSLNEEVRLKRTPIPE